MRKIFLSFAVLALMAATAAVAQNVSNYMEHGGSRWVIGGSADVISGGELDIESGGALKIAGTPMSSSAAELNYLDITTLGTGAASKAVVLNASGDYTYPATGTIVYPSSATLTLQSGSTFNAAGTFQIGGVTVAAEPLQNPGRGSFVICGEATTVNNNTVYYGPDVTLLGTNAGLTCDINATGNTTEATADAPILTNQAFHVTGMICRNEGDANAGISYTLRTAAGATTPSVTCTIADGERDCVADVQTTTAIAAGATVAVAAASAGDILLITTGLFAA